MMSEQSMEASASSNVLTQMTVSTVRQFLDISPDALIVINPAGTIVMANRHTTVLFGYPSSEFLGLPLDTLVPERFRVAHRLHRKRYFSAPLARPMGIGLELFGLRKDQSEFPVDISLRPLLLEEELHAIGTIYDVTRYTLLVEAEQRARRAAIERAGELETIFDTMTDGVLVCNVQEHLLHCNAAARRMLWIQAPQSSFCQNSLASRLSMSEFRDEDGHPLTPDRLPLQRILRGETVTSSQAADVRLSTPDGDERWLNMSGAPLYDQQEHIRGAVCVLRDMTEQRRLKRRIEVLDALIEIVETLVRPSTPQESPISSEDLTTVTHTIGHTILQLAQRLLSCSYTIILQIHSQTRMLFPLAMVGFSPEQEQHLRPHLTGAHLSELISDPNTMTLLERHHLAPFDLTSSPLLEHFLPVSDPPHCFFVPIYVAHHLEGLLGVAFSRREYRPGAEEVALITAISQLCALTLQYERYTVEQKRLMETQHLLNEELEHINTTQRTFLSVVGHEFRTSLTSIEGFSALLRDNEYTGEVVKDYAHDINTDALRLHRLITDLLDLEQMKQGKMQLRLEQVEINGLLAQTVKRLELIAMRQTFHLHLDERQPRLEGDPDKLTQVVTNLLSNAIKYSPEGGEIVITSAIESASVHVSIQDHGIGISADAIEHIFTPYHRVASLSTRYIPGTGLGLPLVKLIVEMHQGQVWVESVLGQGSLFHLTFPLYTHKQSSEAE